MAQTADIQKVFNAVISGETVKLLFFDKKSYDSFRVSLLRKFRNYRNFVESLGGSRPLADNYIKCSFDGTTGTGTYSLGTESERKNIPSKVYQVEEL